MFILIRFLRKFIRFGRLTIADPDGRLHVFGSGAASNGVQIRIAKRSLPWKLALRPDLYLGEAYMHGELLLEQGDIAQLLEILCRNLVLRSRSLIEDTCRRLAWALARVNSIGRSRKNVEHHYDLSESLFTAFLDVDRQYSCAYFRHPNAELNEAQHDKMKHIAAKLSLRANMHVLDIGCGWGGLALHFAKSHGVYVDGITLSQMQLSYARERAKAVDQADRVRFSLDDFRAIQGQYDRIVSVGMFEHVGRKSFGEFFRKLRDALHPDGVALVHSIGRMNGASPTSAWIQKYIFPGGYIPPLSEVIPEIESAGLWITDIEILRLHYAETLKIWRQRFMENWPSIEHEFDPTFRRMWEFYLASSEAGFRYGGLMVFQIQISRRCDAVPLTRDYIQLSERAEARDFDGTTSDHDAVKQISDIIP